MEKPLAGDKRRMTRKVLCYYLRVINIEDGRELGKIADITTEGMMLFGTKMLDKEKIYSVRVILHRSVFNVALGNLDVKVQIRWSKPDANPSLILTGMLFLELDARKIKIINNLVSKLAMQKGLNALDPDEEEAERNNSLLYDN